MTPEQRDPMHRGRRKTDWTLKRIIEVGTVLGMLAAGYTYLAARWATKAEVASAVQPVADTLAAFKRSTAIRLDAVEIRQSAAERRQDLIPGFLRLQCLQLRRDRSESLAEAAGVPCDSLLQRRR